MDPIKTVDVSDIQVEQEVKKQPAQDDDGEQKEIIELTTS